MPLNPYAIYLNGQEPMPVLISTNERLRALTAGLSDARINARQAAGKWSMCEIIAHLADSELVFAFRMRQTLAEDHPVLQPFDQEVWSNRYASYGVAAALALFQAVRGWNLLLLATVSEDDRERPTTHPERGTMTFWTIVETMAGHDINHLQQLERLAG